MKKPTENRGGKRKGAGRPPLKDKERNVSRNFMMTPGSDLALDFIAAKKDESRSQVVRRLVLRSAKRLGYKGEG